MQEVASARHLMDLATHRRGMQLRNGIALVGRLLRSAADLGIDLRTSSPQSGSSKEGWRRVRSGAGRAWWRSGGSEYAGGCSSPPADSRTTASAGAKCFPPIRIIDRRGTSATGDGLRLGESVGGKVDGTSRRAGRLVPGFAGTVSRRHGRSFSAHHRRGKPGIIAVLADGRRFCNEGNGYHDYVAAMLHASTAGAGRRILADLHACVPAPLRLGIARPVPLPVSPYIRSGYIKVGKTIVELAQNCGINPEGLERTVTEYNLHARNGEDPAFGRGSTAYNRLQGDAGNSQTPCVAPIERGPFYAVKVVPGSFGTFAGLRPIASARVLDGNKLPIPGLYAAGTDMAECHGRPLPGRRNQLGPAMTFGYIAGRHAAGVTGYEDARGIVRPEAHA